MLRKRFETSLGSICYWSSEKKADSCCTLVFLPGLTADHRLFEQQTAYFEKQYRVFVWDAPGHGESWPFELSFTLMDKARWLDDILETEHIDHPVIIGQSMGGYVGQAFMQCFPGKSRGFISIDSAPLQRIYVTGLELWLLKRMYPVYRYYPWGALVRSGSKGCAVSAYGRKLMYDMMMVYQGDQERYARLSGHGFQIVADAIGADLPYRIDCPALLICGDRDQAGSTKRYNRAWHKTAGIPIEWIAEAGHNSNTDQPQKVNALIEAFVKALPAT